MILIIVWLLGALLLGSFTSSFTNMGIVLGWFFFGPMICIGTTKWLQTHRGIEAEVITLVLSGWAFGSCFLYLPKGFADGLLWGSLLVAGPMMMLLSLIFIFNDIKRRRGLNLPSLTGALTDHNRIRLIVTMAFASLISLASLIWVIVNMPGIITLVLGFVMIIELFVAVTLAVRALIEGFKH